MYQLAVSLPVYEVDGSREHGALGKLITSLQEMAMVGRGGEKGKMAAYLLDKLNGQKLSDQGKDLAIDFILNQAYTERLFHTALKVKEKKLREVWSRGEEIDKNTILKFIHENVAVARAEFDAAKDEDKDEVFGKKLAPYYDLITSVAFNALSEKK